MQLPRVKIQFLNGLLGTVSDSTDGLTALVCGATAVAGTLALGTAYTLTCMDDLTALGVTSANNATLYRHVSAFYDEAGSGVKLVLFPVAASTSLVDLCDYTKTGASSLRTLITGQNGALRGIGIAGVGTTASSETAGIAADVYSALPKAQQLAEWATTELYAPLFIALEGRNYDSSKELTDLTSQQYNRCLVMVGDTESDSTGAAIGLLLGRVAVTPVQRNIGRVRTGALTPSAMYLGSKKVEENSTLVSAIYEKGYLVPRKYVGRTGYYFADDTMACDGTDDYAHLATRRVIDKAYRIAYDTMLDALLDELEVNSDGTLQTGVVKYWQQTVANAVNRQMTANGELSATDGEGCVCYVDETQNVVSTSSLQVTLKVTPYGYARYVNVNLGFNVQTA
jgi:hypothetical protein